MEGQTCMLAEGKFKGCNLYFLGKKMLKNCISTGCDQVNIQGWLCRCQVMQGAAKCAKSCSGAPSTLGCMGRGRMRRGGGDGSSYGLRLSNLNTNIVLFSPCDHVYNSRCYFFVQRINRANPDAFFWPTFKS